MSLINDALKRARQAQPKTPPPTVPGAPLRPVEAARLRNSGPGMVLSLGVVMVLVIGVVVWWALSRGGTGKSPAPVVTQETRELPTVAARATKPVPSGNQQSPAPVPPPIVAPAVSPAVASTTSAPPSETVPPPVAPPVAVSPPAVVAKETPPGIAWPKLQGIFYRPDRPSVLLNGKTFFVGERSGDFLVLAIDRQSVTLVCAGQTNVLRMAQ